MDILKGILESFKGGGKIEMSSRDAIVRGIQKELRGEKFLLVLDDVWNEDSRSWDSFFASLVGPNSTSGSCCVLTTRLQTTANLVPTSSLDPFVLDKLSDDDCWFIIGRKATKGGEIPEGLEVHKEGILKKCQGLPLAVNAIGGLLSLQRKEDWFSIMENKILKVSEIVEGKITLILKLSYDYLPSPHIKKCFVYCSVYPKDAVIGGQELIELWMAEGYLQDDKHGRTTMEEHGADCLKILLQSSLLAEIVDGYYNSYQMHDLVHDLAESIAERERFDEEYKYLQCRHLRIVEKELEEDLNVKSKLVQIVKGDISDEILLKYRHVRVLHFYNTKETNLLSIIGKLKHVRWLDLSNILTKKLPEALGKLYNLQTLRLSNLGSVRYLPQGLSNLISLRHFHFYSYNVEFNMPPMMGRLTNLQTLEFFSIGEKNGCGIEELGTMRSLKGRFEICNLELVKGKEEAGRANMIEKKNLMRLNLCWGQPIDGNNRDDELVLEGLEPCPTLQELKIENYMGVRLPGWLGKLSALVELELDNCTELVGFDNSSSHFLYSLEKLTISGAIQVSRMSCLSEVIENPLASSLKELCINSCNLVDISSSALECFPKLECLDVGYCWNLSSCPLDLQQTPSLSIIKFIECPKLFITNDVPSGFNHLTNLKTLHIGPFSTKSIQLFNWSGLKSGCSATLQVLHLAGCPHSFLLEQLQLFSSLVELELSEFESLECLPDWFGNLKSLQELELVNCPRLQHFPSTHVMELLNNLRQLQISNCPLLRESSGHEVPVLPNLIIRRD